jgi:hypothetical protein
MRCVVSDNTITSRLRQADLAEQLVSRGAGGQPKIESLCFHLVASPHAGHPVLAKFTQLEESQLGLHF